MFNPFVATFIKVVDCGSFSRAAEELPLSKVSVMKQINALEETVGATLFKRTHRGVILTDAGKSFYQNIKEIIRLSEATVDEAQRIAHNENQKIRIGSSIMRPCNRFIELFESKIEENRYSFEVVLFNDNVDGLTPMLDALDDKIDCFISPCGSTKILMDYGFLSLSECKCAVAMSRNHVLAEKELLRMEDFCNQTVLLIKRGNSYVVDQMRDHFIKSYPAVKIVDFDGYYDISAFNLCNRQGYLMETLDIWENLYPSLKTVAVDWAYKMPYGIIYSKKPTDKVKRFIDYISCHSATFFHSVR